MKASFNLVLAAAVAAAIMALPVAASAGTSNTRASANSGVCKSGKTVRNVKSCKENGGTN
jgi:hypothetical protein